MQHVAHARTSQAFSPSSTALRFLSSLAAAAFAGSTWHDKTAQSERKERAWRSRSAARASPTSSEGDATRKTRSI